MIFPLSWRSLLLVSICLLSATGLAAQDRSALFQAYQDASWEAGIEDRITDFDLYTVDAELLQSIAREKAENLVLHLPFEGGMTLLLEQQDLLNENFQVYSGSAQQKEPFAYQAGAYYKGRIQGQEHSFAALSFFEGEIIGVIADDQGNINLGTLAPPTGKEGLYAMIYRESAHRFAPQMSCDERFPTQERAPDLAPQLPENANSSSVPFCFSSYLEGDFALFQDRGSSVANATNFITGAWNVVAVIFDNEQLIANISEIFIWTTPDGYSTASSGAALDDFANAMAGGFNGDLAHLISRGPNSFGGIAYVDVVCINNSFFKTAVSRIGGGYNQFPNYSWTVNVLSHEVGHNLGSPHTHACAWNGNSTQIDDAGNIWLDNNGGNPGFCYNSNNPILPPEGGTIMSYGHLVGGFGINFNNGFGTQPGDLIRSVVSGCSDCSGATVGCTNPNAHNYNPNATQDNGSCQTCDDGLLNGTEVGVDCGGPLCAPCNCDHPDIPALVQLYNNTNGNNWNNNGGWSQGLGACSPCDWFGITCENDRVVEINLTGNGLTGSLPNSINELTQLRRLNLWNNNLTGSIPSTLYLLFNLEYIDFGNSSLTGGIAALIDNLSALEVFYVENNNLSGNLPASIYNLPNLQIIWLTGNNFSGTLSLGDNQWPSLTEIRIQDNNFIGDLPAALGNLTNLSEIDFSNNNFSGCFPETYENFCGLNDVSFSGNSGLPGNGDFANFCASGSGGCGDCSLFTGLLEVVESEICSGDEITLFLSLDQLGNNGPYTFSYTENGNLRTIPNVPNFGTFFPISPTVTTTYVLTSVTDAEGCELINLSEPFTVTVLPDATCNPVFGCMDPEAHNYDPTANNDDGSCETCSDGIQNGDETGIDCGGSLCGPCLIPGCTDPAAHNYNPAATVDDGSCETCSDGIQNGDETGIDCGGSLCGPCLIPGCTDPVAHNYNPAATVDDGSCETCSDGIQNGDETGVDCGGSLCG
ncbi:MAG: M12 family metallo-peptidase, partial [Bacteroidota bacterium]